MNRIFIDMDGVLVDFDLYKRDYNLSGSEVKKKEKAYFEMKPIDGSLEAVHQLIEMGYEVWIASKPPTGVPYAYADKVAWILKYLPELERRIVLSHDKGFLGDENDYLCDDRPHKANCEEFRGKLVRFVNGFHWNEALAFFKMENERSSNRRYKNNMDYDKTVQSVGERYIKSRIIDRLQGSSTTTRKLVGGLGHDAGILKNPFDPEDMLLVNTDRSGVNKAYNLGLAGGECIADFAISHAISDILATGGVPFAVSVALLLPGETPVQLVDEIIDGIELASTYYGVTLTGGDTKKSDMLSLVVTALGKAPAENLLYRNTPRVGDQLVVTGYLGSMLLGSIVHKKGLLVPESVQQVVDQALIQQRPPYHMALEISKSRVAHACTDISDGLQAACRNMIGDNDFGVELIEDQIPVHPELKEVANDLSLSPLQLSMAGGDWQFLYCIPKKEIPSVEAMSKSMGSKLTVIGEVSETNGIWAKTLTGEQKKLRQIENDSFTDRINGKSYFSYLSDPLDLFE
ncbi:MAG: AIR synthase related protein [Candidatus Thiodiazotropha sp.]